MRLAMQAAGRNGAVNMAAANMNGIDRRLPVSPVAAPAPSMR